MMSRRQAFAALAAMLPGEVAAAADEEKPDVEDLVKLLADAVKYLQLTSPPIGSVQAFAGDWPPRKMDGTKWAELGIGWLLCDGRNLNDVQTKLHKELEEQKKKIPEDGILADLRAVLPRLKGGPAEALPDYRGIFLRGVDQGMDGKPGPGQYDKGDIAKDGKIINVKRVLGTVQSDSTARPRFIKFTTNTTGRHNHENGNFKHLLQKRPDGEHSLHNSDRTIGEPDLIHAEPIIPGGEHWHNIESGGDLETRPINIAVNYIIKFR